MSHIPVYIINLKRRPDRRKSITHQLQTQGFYNLHYIDAVDGKRLSENDIRRFTAKNALQSRQRHEDINSVGAIGCYLSHMHAWQKVMASNRSAMIVEDDLTFEQPVLDIVASIFNDTKQFDLILLHYILRRFTFNVIQTGLIPYNKEFFSCACYILTAQGAQQLLDQALPIEMQVDCYMATKGLNTAIYSPLITQASHFTTDIQTNCFSCGMHHIDLQLLLFATSILLCTYLLFISRQRYS